MEMDPITILAIVLIVIVSFVGWFVDKYSDHGKKNHHK